MTADLKNDLAALRIEREPERPGVGRWILWTGLLILVAALGFAAYRWFTRERPVEVQVATVTSRAAGTQAAVLNASGYVTARRRATVSSKITGKVVEVNVEEGKAVREGQVLARLDDSAVRAALNLAQAQLAAAKTSLRESEVRRDQSRLTLNRDKSLLKDGIVTQAEVEAAQADVDTYEARIAAATQQIQVNERAIQVTETDLDNTVIRAPFSGIVVTKDA